MLKVLIVKTSSMGDIIHTLPALTDASLALKNVTFDWVVESGFAEIPAWHPAVKRVISCDLRKWRKSPFACLKEGTGKKFIKALRDESYDCVIDAQGLIKSALITRLARGRRRGPNQESAREGAAALFYHDTYTVPQAQHAVVRMRQLFAQALGYSLPLLPPDYGIRSEFPLSCDESAILFLHGTTWTTKHWPTEYWQQLALLVSKAGFRVMLPWGNETERERAERILAYCKEKACVILPQVLPKLSLREITSYIAKAKGIVAVDTGLGHMAAALAVPTVSLYGPTDPLLTGAYGPAQFHLKSSLSCSPCLGRECKKGQNFARNPPCFESLTPEVVWRTLTEKMD